MAINPNVYSKNYTTSNSNLSGTVGVPASAINGVSPLYVVTIVATLGSNTLGYGAKGPGTTNGQNEFTINAFLQDKITLNASSKWEGLTQDIPGNANADKWAGVAEFATQSVLGRTLTTPLTTRRKWAGSDPISMTMKLKFESFTNTYNEVLLPCIGLQSLTLPRGGIGNTIGLIPPGPSPFDFNLKGQPVSERTENIKLSIGGFLNFNSVIIKDVGVTFENRMSASGPIGAEVALTIETYQMLTREDLMNVAGVNGLVSGSLGQISPA